MPENRCPSCGVLLPANAPGGHCPRCMLLQGLESDPPSLDRGSKSHTLDLSARPGSVLATISTTIGAVPHVLLRDATSGEEPGPILRPNGPDAADTSIRYRIDGEIARGGMGAILKGRDPDLGRDVALKVLREDLRDDDDMVRRFVEEAQIGGQLQHPGVVPIYELGTFADRRPFFSMKLVKGHTLASVLSERGMADKGGGASQADLPRFLSIFEAVCQTVAYTHARGVIHRDLKPSNVMVGSFGEVQVMDWGLAKVLPRGGVADDEKAGRPDRQETVIATARSGSDSPGLSHPGSAMGTPSYMAPEQARGEGERVDERADVFALGSILCEVLTGGPAFLGRSSGEIMRKAALGDLADALEPAEFTRLLRRQPESVVIELSAFLDAWSNVRRAAKRPVAAWRRPLEAARLADPNPYRDRLRKILLAEDRRSEASTLVALAAAPEAADLPAPTAVLLGEALVDNGQAEAAVALLRLAAIRHPADVWVNYVLAGALDNLRPAAREEAVRYYTAARALRPETAHWLAHLLEQVGRGGEAEAVFRDVTRRRPENPGHLTCLGKHLKDRGRSGDAAPILDRAIAAARSAIRLVPDDAVAHYNLGNALAAQGKLDEGIAEFRTAIRLQPDDAKAHANLGNALRGQRKVDEALAEYRTAIRLQPDYALAHCALGFALRGHGDYAGAVTMLRRGHELGIRQSGWSYPSAQWVAEAERLAALAPRLPALLRGEDRPKDVAERAAVAKMCYHTKRFAAAARFCGEAFAADPRLAEDLKAGNRYDAACSAALAGAGQGTGDPKPDDAARTKLRGQALDWLTAERAAWAKDVDGGDAKARAQVVQTLNHWKVDPDLAGVREPDALAKLPEPERKEWQAFWAGVDSLLKRAATTQAK